MSSIFQGASVHMICIADIRIHKNIIKVSRGLTRDSWCTRGTKTRICRIAAWTCNNWHDPCITIYAENHAYDHNKIVNIELNSKYFNVAESACLQCMSSASDWSNSTCQPFLTSNWHFWQMVQMSAQCLLCKTEKAQISGQMQIICTGWQNCWWGLTLSWNTID